MLKEDFRANKNNTKGLLFILVFRFASFFTKRKLPLPIKLLVKLLVELPYTFFVQWMFTIDIPCTTTIGKGFQLYHGHGTVINSKCIIGDYVKVRQNVTIGNSITKGKCPVIGNYVEIGSNSVIIGGISVGNHVKVGALTLVNKDVEENATVVGIPFKVIS